MEFGSDLHEDFEEKIHVCLKLLKRCYYFDERSKNVHI